MIIFSLVGIVIAYILYYRYVPVSGVSCDGLEDLDMDKIILVDLRDYNVSYKDPIKGSINLPIAYLNKFYKAIPKGELHVIGSNLLEKNVGIRFLRHKGYKVIGFTIIENKHMSYKENLCA